MNMHNFTKFVAQSVLAWNVTISVILRHNEPGWNTGRFNCMFNKQRFFFKDEVVTLKYWGGEREKGTAFVQTFPSPDID